MRTNRSQKICARLLGAAPLAVAAFLAVCGSLPAAPLTTSEVIERVGIDQKLNTQIPADVELRDETGAAVKLGEFFSDKPIILNLVYFRCPMLCNLTMDGLQRTLHTMSLDVGKDFTVLTVSFDPREGPELASKARQTALKRYGRAGAERGWRFLTGEEPNLKRLTDAVGFRYAYDEERAQSPPCWWCSRRRERFLVT
jgi:protein SCO1/2